VGDVSCSYLSIGWCNVHSIIVSNPDVVVPCTIGGISVWLGRLGGSPCFGGLGVVRGQGGHEESGQDYVGRHVSGGLDGDLSKCVGGQCGDTLRSAVCFPYCLDTRDIVSLQINS